MASTVGSLVIEIMASMARFESDLGRAVQIAENTGKRIEGAFSSANSAMLKIAGAVAAGFSVVAIKGFVDQTAVLEARLDDLAEQTGSTVEQMSKFQSVAELGGGSAEQVADAMTKMVKGLSDMTGETKGAHAALNYLGIAARDASGKLKDPGVLMDEIAAKMNGLADGAGKTAIAMDLWGKSGAALLPTIKDMGVAGDLLVRTTAEQAAAAEEYQKNLVRLRFAKEQIYRTLAHELIPVLNDFVRAMIASVTQTGGMRDKVEQLAKDGSLKEWFRGAALGAAWLVDAASGVVTAFEVVGKAVAAVLVDLTDLGTIFAGVGYIMTGQFGRGLELIKEGWNNLGRAGREFAADLEEIGARTSFSDRLRAAFAETDQAARKSGETIRRTADDYRTGATEGERAAERLQAAFEALRQSLAEKLARGRNATELEQLELKLTEEKYAKLLPWQREELRQLAMKIDAQKLAVEMAKQEARLEQERQARAAKDLDALRGYTLNLIAQGDELEFQLSLFGKTKEQADILIAQRRIEIELQRVLSQLTSETSAEVRRFYTETAEAQKQRIAALIAEQQAQERQLAQFESTWQSVDRTARDVWTNIFEGGSNVFKKLRDTLKATVLDLLYQMTVRKWVFNITAAVTGSGLPESALANVFGASGGGGGGDLLSFGGSLLGGIGTASSSISAAFSTFAGNAALGLGASGSAALGIAGAAGMVGAAIPYIGIALGIASALGLFDKDPSETRGRVLISGGTTGFEDSIFTRTRFGNIGFADADTAQFSGEGARQFAQLIGGTLDALAERMTPDQIAAVSARLQGAPFSSFEGTFSTEDFIRRFGPQMQREVVAVAFDELAPALAALARAFQGTADETGQFLNALLAVYDVTRRLPAGIGERLVDALDGTQRNAEQIVALGAAYATVAEAQARNPIEDGIEAYARATEGSYAALMRQSGALLDLGDAFDGSAEKANELAGATSAFYQAAVDAVGQIRALRVALADMFGATGRGILMSTLSPEQQWSWLFGSINEALGQLGATTDPQAVQRLAERLNADINAAWNLIPEEARGGQLSFFQGLLDTAQRATSDALTRAEQGVQTTVEATLSRIEGALAGAVDRLADAASRETDNAQRNADAAAAQQRAAEIQLAAAATPIVVSVSGLAAEVGG